VAPVRSLIRSNSYLVEEIARTGSNHTLNALKSHRPEWINTRSSASMNHGKLPANLVACNWVIRSYLCGVRYDIEVRKCRLDHYDICTFRSVPLLFEISTQTYYQGCTYYSSSGQTTGRRGKLIAFSVSKSRRTTCCISVCGKRVLQVDSKPRDKIVDSPKRSIERGSKLGRVTHQ